MALIVACVVFPLVSGRAEAQDPSAWERGVPEISESPAESASLEIRNTGLAPFGVQIVWRGGIWSSHVPPGESRTVTVDGGGRVDYVLTAGKDSVKDGFEIPAKRSAVWEVQYDGSGRAGPLPPSLAEAESPVSFEVSGDEFIDFDKKSDEDKIRILEEALAGKYRGHAKMTEVLATLHNNRGLVLQEEDRWADAVYHLRRAAQLTPGDRTVLANLAVLQHNHAVKMMDSEGFPAAEREILAALDTARGLGEEVEGPLAATYADMLTRDGIDNEEKGRTDSAARRFRQALDLKPDIMVAWVRLGEIHYGRHELDEAADCYRRAVAILPREDLVERLQRIERELAVAGEFTTSEVGRFIISFQGNENESVSRDVRQILRRAYRDVGGIFHFYPKSEVAVVIYDSGQFLRVTQLHGWAGAVYDGKIRLRIDPVEKRDRESMLARLKEQVYHEYTHALIHSLVGGARLPVWLHEGLAQYAENQARPGREETAELTGHLARGGLPAMSGLADPFAGMADSRQASLAYLQSRHFVRYLIDSYGLPRIRRFLGLLGDGMAVEKAAERAFGRPLSRLEGQWREGLL